MLNLTESRQILAEYSNFRPGNPVVMESDSWGPLLNLSVVRSRMDSLQRFLSDSVNSNTLITKGQMDMVSSEISAAIQQTILNGAALLACSQTQSQTQTQIKTQTQTQIKTQTQTQPDPRPTVTGNLKVEEVEEQQERDEFLEMDCEIVELDAVELLAEHIHFCEICGKGFKRDANLRMHMRAHGNQFKTPEALAKPERVKSMEEMESKATAKKTRFSCPYEGCNRNKRHKKFRPLKSVICVRNHFKRSHCPKLYSCNRCHKKSFSVVADLKSHLKHCGENKWKCSCGTSFSRKDKLFGHMALFEGHMPAVAAEEPLDAEEEPEMEEGIHGVVKEDIDDGLFDGLLDGFGSIENCTLQDVLGSPNGLVDWNEGFL